MREKTDIMVSPTGARRSKADHPWLPISIDEIAQEAADCFAAGASAIHLHVRDQTGAHSIDPVIYAEAMAEVRAKAPGLAIQITTEVAGKYSVQDQFQTLSALKPASASLSIREAARDPDLAARLYAMANDNGIALQHLIYDHSDLTLLREYQRNGVIIDAEPDILLVFGAYHPPRNAQVDAVATTLSALNGDYPNWAACAFGQTEEAVLLEVARQGGNVRIGFENNIHLPDGSLAISTADNVARFLSALATQNEKIPA